MPKHIRTDKDEEMTDNLPPMPTTKEELPGPDSSSPSTSLESEPGAVSEALAGDLIALPFEAWHLVQPACDPLSEAEKARLAGPFSRIMEKYGLGKVAKDEILLGFYLTAVIYGRVKAVAAAKKQAKMVQTAEETVREVRKE